MTDELTFRAPQASDLAEVFRIHGDPRTNVHNPAGPDTVEDSQAVLDEWIKHWRDHGFGYEVIEDAEGSMLGVAGILHSTWLGDPVLNLYYRLAPEAWGRGLATNAAKRALSVATRVAPGVAVLARTRPENLPSQRVAEKIGLTRRRDLEVGDDVGPVVIYSTHSP